MMASVMYPVESIMNNTTAIPTPREIDMYLAKAHAMRAEAMRHGFKTFYQLPGALMAKFAAILRVPQTSRF